MKLIRFTILALAFLGIGAANAQTRLQQYQPGFRTINGSQLNLMVNAVNNLTGNGTAGAITGTTGTFSGALTSGAHTITSASANALAVGLAGTTNPALKVDVSTASSATGLQIKSAAAASGVALLALSSGTNENLTLDAKGSGTISFNVTGTGNIVMGRAVTGVSNSVTGALTARSATATPAAASAVAALSFGSDAIGVYWGTGAPSISATKGSLYIQTDGSSTSTRLFINNGTTNWIAITTAS